MSEPGVGDRTHAPSRLLGRLVFAAAFALCLGHLGVIAFQRDASLDLPWHLALGNEMLDTGRFASTNRYSHTAAGRPYHLVPWLFDVAFAAAYRASGGLAGPMLLRLALLVGAFLALYRLMRARGTGPGLALGVLTIAFELARLRLQLRPELCFPPFLAALLWILHLAETRRPAWLLAAVPLCALFANVHPGLTPLLILLLGCHAGWRVVAWLAPAPLERLVGPRPPARVVALAVGVAAAAALATALNPTGFHAIAAARLVSPVIAAATREYASIPYVFDLPLRHAFLALAAVAIIGGWHRRALPGALATAALAILSLRHTRMGGAFALTAAPFVAEGLTTLGRRLAHAVVAARLAKWRGAAFIGLAALIGLGAWQAYGDETVHRNLGARHEPGVYPRGAVDFLAQSPPGRLINEFGWGGYLLWRLGPAHPVFIDGRVGMLYDDAILSRYLLTRRDPLAFAAECERQGVTRAVLRMESTSVSPTRLPGWRTVYFDDVAVIYARDVGDGRELVARHGLRYLDPRRAEPLLLLVGDPDLPLIVAEADRLLADPGAGVAAHRLRAVLAAAAGDLPRLESELAQLRHAGVFVEPTLITSAALLAVGRHDEARARLERARPVIRDAPFALVLRARAAAARGAAPEARALLGPVDAMPEAQLLLEELSTTAGDAAGASAARERFLAAVGDDPVYATRAARAGARRAAAATAPAGSAAP